jgi:nicotinamide riboside kinase
MSLVIALLGAECTGKSTLTQALGQRLADVPAATVPEHLRDWCLAQGRTPRRLEQAHIAAEQQRQIQCAAAACPVVVADTTALMTALYSTHYFNDFSLMAAALAAHRRVDLTLLCAPEGIPWQADGWLRDGDATRQRTHQELARLLDDEDLPHLTLRGTLPERMDLAEAWVRDRLRSAAPRGA